jgi:DNA-binding NtrC family response regulator
MAPTPQLLTRLSAYAWPGNVRELENALESAVALSEGGALDLGSLPADEGAPASAPPAAAEVPDFRAPLKTRVDAYERGLVLQALAAAKGNRSEAARLLGIARATLHEKLNRYGI